MNSSSTDIFGHCVYPCPYCDDASGGIAGEDARRSGEGTITLCPFCLGGRRAFDPPGYVHDFWASIWDAMEVAYWNRHQREFRYDDRDDFAIPGITYRPYYWGDDQYEAALPNFVCERRPDVCLKFYKRPRRGLEVNRELSCKEWVCWRQDCLDTIAEYEAASRWRDRDDAKEADDERVSSLSP